MMTAILAVIAWGASFVFTRMALASMTPFTLVALRLLIGVVVLAIIIRWRGGAFVPERQDVPASAVLGLILSVHLSIQAFGLQYTSAINTGWIIGAIPVCIAVAAHLLGRQHIRPTGWLGTFVGTSGVFLVTVSATPDFRYARWGDLLQMCSCLTWTAYTIIGDAPVKRSGSFRVTLLAMTVAVLVLSLPALFQDRSAISAASIGVPGRTALAVLFLGIVCSGLAFFWWSRAVAEHGPARVGALLYFEPLVTLGASLALLRDESVTLTTLVGGAMVLFGVWLVAKGSQQRPAPRIEGAESNSD